MREFILRHKVGAATIVAALVVATDYLLGSPQPTLGRLLRQSALPGPAHLLCARTGR